MDELTDLNANLDAFVYPEELDALAATYDLLGRYAKLKAAAMRKRIDGYINDALRIESKCDALYKRIPDQFRHW